MNLITSNFCLRINTYLFLCLYFHLVKYNSIAFYINNLCCYRIYKIDNTLFFIKQRCIYKISFIKKNYIIGIMYQLFWYYSFINLFFIKFRYGDFLHVSLFSILLHHHMVNQHQLLHSLFLKQQDLHGLQRIHLLPYLHQRTSEQKHA